MREALAYHVYRAAGVFAPRTTFVKVYLDVPGKYVKEYLGLYTLVEDIDKAFLRDRFGSARGLLLKPEDMRGIEHLGDKWEAYEKKYLPRTKVTAAGKKRLQRLTWLVDKGDDATFAREIRSLVDIDNFLKFVAVTGLVSNLDSFIGLGHNYYMYLDPRTDQFVWIPWDLNLAFAGMPFGGSGVEQMRLSVDHPHMRDVKLIDRLFAIPEVKKEYHAIVRRLVADVYSAEKLLPVLDRMVKGVAEPIALDLAKALFTKASLSDKKLTRPEMQKVAERLFAEADKDKDGKLDEAELLAAVRRLVPDPGFPPKK